MHALLQWTTLLEVALLSLADFTAAATISHGRRAADESITPPSRSCNSWVPVALYGNVTEANKLWDFGYPDFSNQSKVPVAVLTCSSETQRSVRVGPYPSRPGGTYDIMTDGLIDSLFSIGDRITSFSAMPVTHLGEPVGYPPFYVHHIHVGRLTHYYDEHWFTTHGDFSIGSDFGIGATSTKGYTTFLPEGYGFTVDCRLPFAVHAIIQDMRTLPLPQDTLSIYIEVNFNLAPPQAALLPATLVWNEAPHGPFGFMRFAVLGDEPTMSWWTMRWPVSGTLLPRAKLHSHYARHHRLFLIDGEPKDLSTFGSHVKEIVQLHESNPPTSPHETMRLRNLTHTELTLEQLPNLLCQDDGTSPSFIVLATDDHPNASRWARRREFLCAPVTVEAGRVSTFVQLYRPVADPDVQLYPMHTNTWFYLERPNEASSSDIKAVSYRYATYRTTSLLEPLQNEEIGNCQSTFDADAVNKYVANTVTGLSAAVEAAHAGHSGDAIKAGTARIPVLEAQLCTNTCHCASDGDCDDGGPGGEFSFCALGTDCADCGPRTPQHAGDAMHAGGEHAGDADASPTTAPTSYPSSWLLGGADERGIIYTRFWLIASPASGERSLPIAAVAVAFTAGLFLAGLLRSRRARPTVTLL